MDDATLPIDPLLYERLLHTRARQQIAELRRQLLDLQAAAAMRTFADERRQHSLDLVLISNDAAAARTAIEAQYHIRLEDWRVDDSAPKLRRVL